MESNNFINKKLSEPQKSEETQELIDKQQDRENLGNSDEKYKINIGTNKEKIEKFIGGIDFKSLQNVLTTVLKKTGVNLERLKEINPNLFEMNGQAIFVENMGGNATGVALFGYSPDTGMISIADDPLLETLSKEVFFLSLVHEIIHSISDINLEDEGSVAYSRVGLSESGHSLSSEIPKFFQKNNLINEGLTELVAEAVTVEYFRRNGENHNLTEEFNRCYHIGKDMVRILVYTISEECNQPEDVIFLALVKTLFNYDFDEFIGLLGDEYKLSEILEKMSNLNSDSDIIDIDELTNKATYRLDKLRVKGLEHITRKAYGNRDDYYNPLIESLK